MKAIEYSILLILALAMTFGCERSNQAEAGTEEIKDLTRIEIAKDEFYQAGLGLDTVRTTALPINLKLNGTIDVPPNNRAVISALKGGFIKEIPVLEGEKVRRNQYLAQVESMEFLGIQKSFLEAEQDLKYLQAEYHRQKQLYDERISSEKKFQQAENAFTSKQIQLGELREILRMLHFDPEKITPDNLRSTAPILSPFDGHVSRVYVHSGVHLNSGDPLMEIINSEHVHVELKVYEKDALLLQLDQKVHFKVPEISDEFFTGQVYRVGKVIHDDRTILVHVHVEEEDNDFFMPGMYVEAKIAVGDQLQNSIAKTLVKKSGFKYFAYELMSSDSEAYVFERRSIPVADEEDDYFILSDSIEQWKGKVFLKDQLD